MHYQSVKIRMMLHRPWPGSKSHIEEPKNFFFRCHAACLRDMPPSSDPRGPRGGHVRIDP
jgi:hypothetical protein